MTDKRTSVFISGGSNRTFMELKLKNTAVRR